MPALRKYDQETRDRAVRMYPERRQTHSGESAIESRRQIGALIDVKSETMRGWVLQAVPARQPLQRSHLGPVSGHMPQARDLVNPRAVGADRSRPDIAPVALSTASL